ncbi:hypothetical protein PRIPAC_70400, partial [Pristionchus pacificus]|uniref:Uncharacterized protein n=1 Tax=Pristionchus pacificus TaxID=54126 RepID=A0A2A6CSA3_PRIPA
GTAAIGLLRFFAVISSTTINENHLFNGHIWRNRIRVERKGMSHTWDGLEKDVSHSRSFDDVIRRLQMDEYLLTPRSGYIVRTDTMNYVIYKIRHSESLVNLMMEASFYMNWTDDDKKTTIRPISPFYHEY